MKKFLLQRAEQKFITFCTEGRVQILGQQSASIMECPMESCIDSSGQTLENRDSRAFDINV